MADVSITLAIKDNGDNIARVAEAFDNFIDGKRTDQDPVPTQKLWIKQKLLDYIKLVVRQYEVREAESEAVNTALSNTAPEIE